MKAAAPPLSVVLVGNPNVGKSTLFNALSGARQRVVNAPGTTVTLTAGTWRHRGVNAALIDLPGTYSLAAASPDEQVAADAIADRSHDVAVVVLDATALSRSLLLLGQVAATGRPVVAAVTMLDLAAGRGVSVDTQALAKALGVPAIGVNGRTGSGLDDLSAALPHAAPVAAAPDTSDPTALFDWVGALVATCTTSSLPRIHASDRIDRLLLSPWFGLPAFFAVTWALFQLTTVAAAPVMDAAAALVDGPLTRASDAVWIAAGAPAWVADFAAAGVLAGVGAVASFIPLMVMMFAAMAALESCGYLARVAVVMDKAMRLMGLDGRAILPLIVGFGCNLPALSATAVLPHARQRLLTGLLVPLTSCTARLTVYLMLAHAFFPRHAGTVVFAMYVASVLLVVGWGYLARRTVMRDLTPEPLIIVLPDYQWPQPSAVGIAVWTRVGGFVRKAGTIIVAATVGLWLAQAIPVVGGHAVADVPVQDSLYGVIATSTAPALAPLGVDDWRVSAALVTGVAAKEVVVAALAQSYAIDPEAADADASLGQSLRRTFDRTSGGHGPAAALALLLFTVGYFPCLATVAELRRLYGWRWTLASSGAQLAGSYVLATAVFQIGSLL